MENINDLKVLKKMVTAGAVHAARLAKHVYDKQNAGENPDEHVVQELLDVTFELTRARIRLEKLEENLADTAS